MVGFADPIPQQRVTVFFRIILMIPHAFVLWILGIVAEVVAVIAGSVRCSPAGCRTSLPTT